MDSNQDYLANYGYIAKQIALLEKSPDNKASKIDFLWRIASAADLYDNLNPSGNLSPEQIGGIYRYIEGFSATHIGSEALAQYRKLYQGESYAGQQQR